MKKLYSFIFALVFFLPASAQGQEWKKNITDWYTDLPFHLVFGLERIDGEVDTQTFTIADGTMRLVADIEKLPITSYLQLGFGKSWFTYRDDFKTNDGESTITLAASLESKKLEKSFGGGVGATLFNRPRLQLDLNGTFNALPEEKNLQMSNVVVQFDGIDIPLEDFILEHTAFSYRWKRTDVKATLRIKPRKEFNLFLVTGFTKLDADIFFNIDNEGEDFIESIGGEPNDFETPIALEYTIPTFEAGIELKLKNAANVSFSAGVLPVKNEDEISPFSVLHGTITIKP
jgi:hypothetical protein